MNFSDPNFRRLFFWVFACGAMLLVAWQMPAMLAQAAAPPKPGGDDRGNESGHRCGCKEGHSGSGQRRPQDPGRRRRHRRPQAGHPVDQPVGVDHGRRAADVAHRLRVDRGPGLQRRADPRPAATQGDAARVDRRPRPAGQPEGRARPASGIPPLPAVPLERGPGGQGDALEGRPPALRGRTRREPRPRTARPTTSTATSAG